MPRFKLKRLLLLFLLPLTYLMTVVARRHPAGVERYYSQGFYAVVSSAINVLTGFARFSIGELLILFFFFGLLLYIAVVAIKIWMLPKEKKLYEFYKLIANFAATFSIILFSFQIFGGLNYYRVPFFETAGFRYEKVSVPLLDENGEAIVGETETIDQVVVPEPATDEEVYALAIFLTQEAQKHRTGVKTDENGNMTFFNTVEENMLISQEVMSRFAEGHTTLRGIFSQPKPLAFSRIFSRFGVKGFFFPFTFEANVNQNIPKHEMLVTMVHEVAHTRGYMSEDTASMISYLACTESGDSAFAYSGTMLALTYTLNELELRSESNYQAVLETMDEGVFSDMVLSEKYWGGKEGVLLSLGNNFNDSYLKANNQPDGKDSYEKMVELLVEYYRMEPQF